MTSNLEKSDGLVHCSVKNAAILCENHRERVMQIELAHLKKKKKEKHFGRLVTFWFGTFAMLLASLGVFSVMKTLEDKQ